MQLGKAALSAIGRKSESALQELQAKKTLASERAQSTATAARSAADSAVTTVVKSTPESVKEATTHARHVASKVITKGSEKAKRKREQWRLYLEAWVKQKVQRRIELLVDRLPNMAKDMLEDPEMPRCASRAKDSMIDTVWPDIREEILWEACLRLDGSKEEDISEDAPTAWCICAFFRYSLYPYDKSFWGCLKNPIYVLFHLVSNLPFPGVCAISYLFIFLVIDKTDSYQLVNFILEFKGTQFISYGIFRSLLGLFTYLGCVTIPAHESEHSCEKYGPGQGMHFPLMVGGFLLQVLLVWLSFFLLRCATEHGRGTLKGAIKFERNAAGSTVFLRRLMFYDLFCFIVCMGVSAYAAMSRSKIDDWQVMHITFVSQVVYGYLSLPFFVLKVPLTAQLIVHAAPTAYDSYGRCRRPLRYSNREKPEKIPLEDEVIDDSEAVSLRERLKPMLAVPMTVSEDDSDEEKHHPPQIFDPPARSSTE